MAVFHQGRKYINYGTECSIADIEISNELVLYVFNGNISPNDIVIKYSYRNSRIRTPKHIHWVVDLLIKKENNPKLVRKFLDLIIKRWNDIKPLNSRDYDTIVSNLVTSTDKKILQKFSILNNHGYYSIEFLILLMELLMLQEKTNNPNAFMFISVVNALQDSDDLFSIISTATHR